MSQEFIKEYNSVVVALAVEYHRRYPMLEIQDIEQVLWLWFLTHPRKYAEWSELGQKDKDKLIAKSLRNAAIDPLRKGKGQDCWVRGTRFILLRCHSYRGIPT
jgi:hypothetical protein